MKRMALVYPIAKVSIELIAIYFHSFEIFIIQLGEMAFCKPVYYYQVKLFSECSKGECFLDDFDALVLRNGLRPHSSARTSNSRTTMRLRIVILKVVSSKIFFRNYQI
jgi:hypothetical protein